MQDQKLGSVLWKGKWLVLLSLVLSVALAVFLTQHSKKVYAATAVLQVDVPTGSTTGVDPNQQLQANATLAGTYAALIADRSFLAGIQPEIVHGTYTLGELQNDLAAVVIKNTALIQLTAQEASPDRARILATDAANAVVSAVAKEAARRAAAQRAQIEAQIARIGSEIKGASSDPERLKSLELARAALTQQLANVVASNITRGGAVSLTAAPTASSTPVKPRPILNYIAGAMLGLLLGIGLAFLRSRLDRGLHSPEEAEQLLSAPVLASIPIRKRFLPDEPVVSEAYDILRANLAFLSLDNALQVITFTSMNPGEGKTSTVEGLAYAAVRGGMSCLIVDADVRTAALSSNFGAKSLPGLTNLIVGTMSIDDAVVEVEPGLCLLPAGPTPPNPPSLLSSGRMREIVAELRERHTLILFDTPPVAHLADASIVASVSDGVALVGRIGVTQRADLPRAVVQLRHTPTPIVGIVLLRPQIVDETYYPLVSDGRGAAPQHALPR